MDSIHAKKKLLADYTGVVVLTKAYIKSDAAEPRGAMDNRSQVTWAFYPTRSLGEVKKAVASSGSSMAFCPMIVHWLG
jgi:hypothetical protein